jgi:hypothetical protein
MNRFARCPRHSATRKLSMGKEEEEDQGEPGCHTVI